MNQSRNYVLYMHQQVSSSVSCHRALPHVTDLIIHLRPNHEQNAIPPGRYMLLTHYVLTLVFILTRRSDGPNEEGMTAC